MRQLDKQGLMEEEIQDLKMRLELLEGDRKAYYETSQWAIRQNKEEIAKLRSHNKELRESLSKLKKQSNFDRIDNPNQFAMTDLEKMDQRICELHKKHDDMQSLVRAKEEKLSEMQDQLDDLRKEAEIFNGKEGATEVDKEIHQLENRLDKAHIKFNEAQSIRKTYEQIVKKLQEERLTFDHQLAQFERTLKTKRTESSEIETMNRDANHAKEMAKAELTRFETQINEERKFREKDLQVRKEQVRQKIEASEKFEFRLLNTADTSAEPTPFDAQKDTSDYDRERQISQYEETIRLIKEAMGVSNLNEVIQKFQSQWDTHTHLAQLQIANEQKIEELKKKRKEMHDELMEAKFNGEGKHNKDKGIMEEFEKHLEGEMARCADLKIKYERVVKLMNNAKAGLQHIMDKLESVVMQGEKTPARNATGPITDESVIPTMESCIQKIEYLLSTVQNKEIKVDGELHSIPIHQPTYNCRVKLHSVQFEIDSDAEDDAQDDDETNIPDRETIKKASMLLISSRSKSKQGKRKKKKVGKDGDEE